MAEAHAPVSAPSGEASTAVLALDGVGFSWPAPRGGDGGSAGFRIDVGRFVLARGEKVLLLGPSGSGKSTLLSLVCGILVPDRGAIRILGTDLVALPSAQRDRFRAEHIGVVFQMFNLLPYGSVLDNVMLPLSFAPGRARRVATMGGGDAEARRLLGRLGLTPAQIGAATTTRLSVGQQQRVAVARALIGTPELVIADEPTSALDADRRMTFLDLAFAELTAAGSALLMVSHDEGIASRFDRVVRLDELLAMPEAA